LEGWVDDFALLMDEERAELHDNIGLVRLVLVKVIKHIPSSVHVPTHPQLHKITFKILHSTTKLLPTWHHYLDELKLKSQVMP
jgi:hypothetical protein